MPTFHCDKEVFEKYLGKTLSKFFFNNKHFHISKDFKELEDLCFAYGIECEEREVEEEKKEGE